MTETSDSATYHYYLALLLPRFSLIATVSLGIIGVSGIYMAWIQLQNINALFNTNYGNILIIKLAAALPLVLLGAYHQLRLHRSVVRVASSGRVGSTMQITQSFDHDSEDEPSKGTVGRKKEINNNSNSKKNDISKFDKTIKIESLLAISVLLVASLLTITSPHPMDMSHMGMMSSTSSSSSPSVMNMTGMQTSVKNSTYVKQVSIMNINTKIEINPFYTGFNIFKIAFTDANGKPYTKVSSAELIFRNEQKDIGPIVVNLHTVRPGIFSVGTFIPQPGEWSIAIAAQRHADYDLNYKFTAKVPNAPAPTSTVTSQKTTTAEKPSSSPNANIIIDMNNNNMQEPLPKFDSFAWLAIGLAIQLDFLVLITISEANKNLGKL